MGGMIDGGKQVRALVLVRHLRQVLDIDVYKARRVLFEGLYRCFGAFFLLGQQGLEVRHAVAAQTAVQTGAGKFQGWMNSWGTASRSSRGSRSVLRGSTTTAPGPG